MRGDGTTAAATFYITQIEDPIGFQQQMVEQGIGSEVVMEKTPGEHLRVIARLTGWEVIWLARHYPEHTLTPLPNQGEGMGEGEPEGEEEDSTRVIHLPLRAGSTE